VGKSPVFAGLFESRHGHHAESILTRAGHIRVSIDNAAQGYIFTSKSPAADASEAQASAEAPDSAQAADDTTGTVVEQVGVTGKPVKGLLGSDPYDELNLGKKYFRTSNYGLAEKHFRAAVEKHPRDAEAWIGLAASYDRLRRFDLADRAYGQAVGIVGPTVEILNNQGFSYMLRGDYKRAHAALAAAQRKDPGNKYVQNNLRLLEESYRKGKSVE